LQIKFTQFIIAELSILFCHVAVVTHQSFDYINWNAAPILVLKNFLNT
jgi:hypothetical protein